VLTRIIIALVKGCTRYAWLTLVAGVLLAIAAGAYAAEHFAITTDIGKLISPSLDWRQREIAYEKAFPGRNDLILAVVEAPTPELARQAGIRFGQGNAVRPSFAPPDTRERKRDSRVREVPSPPTLSPFT